MKPLTGIIVAIMLIPSLFVIVGSGADVKRTTNLPQENRFEKGKNIYNEKCVVCHQANGEGIKGAFPPLANSDYLLADKKRAVEQVLNGSNEEMVVNGVTYKTPMPPQVDNHEDAVAVINYVLNAWGNEGGTISVEEVKDIKIKR